MKTTILRLSVAGVVIALVGLLGVLYLRQRQAELQQQEATLRDEVAANRRARQAVRAAQAKALTVAPGTAVSADSGASGKGTAPASNLALGSRVQEALMARPDYAPFHQQYIRRSTLRYYGDLLAELKLPPGRGAALKKILEDRLDQGMQLLRETYRQGGNQTSPEYHQALKQLQASTQAAVDALLSADEKTTYERYEKTRHWRTAQQPELEEFLADRGLPPLGAAQKQALAAAFQGSRDWKPDPAEGTVTTVAMHRRRNEEMMKLAAGALDPKQRVVLATFLEFCASRGEIMGRLYHPEKPPGSVMMVVSHSRP